MKIRAGFVSNSSSTSFLIITKRDLNKADFFGLMGVGPDSPIADLFSQFYEDVMDSIETKLDFKSSDRHSPIDELFDRSSRLSARMIEKIEDAKRAGLKVYYGWLDSETSPIQTFFCIDCFEVENKNIYFNGLENVW